MDTLTLYVPAPSSPLGNLIDPGSAIVGEASADDAGRVTIYFEGNRYGAMRDFEEMVLHAADRLITRYPTVARFWVQPSEVIPVGTVDRDTRTIVSIDDELALQLWRSP